MRLAFVKMHGAGNDYVYLDGVAQALPDDLPGLARRMADRHFGIGGDGLICLLPATPAGRDAGAHLRMRMFNGDGSESEMCGNGIRCVGKLAWESGISRENPLVVETGRGPLSIRLHIDGCGGDDGRGGSAEGGRVVSATVAMGRPIFEPERIPIDAAKLRRADQPQTWLLDEWALTCLSMGNPHAVAFVEDVAAVDLARQGPRLERHEAFPRRANIHFVQVLGPDRVRAVHWERGAGPTLACGTGACAICVAGVLTGRTGRRITAELPGGELELEWDETSGEVLMTGETVEVFRGEWVEGVTDG